MAQNTLGTAQQPASKGTPKVPASAWLAHLALVLAVACLTYAASQQFAHTASSTIALGAGILLVIAFAAQAVISRRAHRTRGATAAYVFATIGGVAMIWSRFAGSASVSIALMSIAIACFVAAIAMLVWERRS